MSAEKYFLCKIFPFPRL